MLRWIYRIPDGPYGWPTFESENNFRHIPKIPGVYLQTFEYQGGYLLVGDTVNLDSRLQSLSKELSQNKLTVHRASA